MVRAKGMVNTAQLGMKKAPRDQQLRPSNKRVGLTSLQYHRELFWKRYSQFMLLYTMGKIKYEEAGSTSSRNVTSRRESQWQKTQIPIDDDITIVYIESTIPRRL